MLDRRPAEITVRPLRLPRVAVSALARAAVAAVLTWRRRARERDLLSRMSDRELEDIGIARADADREATKPFWRP